MQRFVLLLDNGAPRGQPEAIGYIRARSTGHAWQRFFRIAQLGELEWFIDKGCEVRVERASVLNG